MNWFIVKLLLKHHENQPTVAKYFKMNCILATFLLELLSPSRRILLPQGA